MITPQQFRSATRHQAESLEKKIDSAINSAQVFGDPVITIGLQGYRSEVVEQVLRDYRSAGWKAEVVTDPRDGDFIRLECTP